MIGSDSCIENLEIDSEHTLMSVYMILGCEASFFLGGFASLWTYSSSEVASIWDLSRVKGFSNTTIHALPFLQTIPINQLAQYLIIALKTRRIYSSAPCLIWAQQTKQLLKVPILITTMQKLSREHFI